MNATLNKYLFYYPVTFLFGENIPQCLAEYQKSQWYSKQTLEAVQRHKLKKLLSFANRQVPYYKRRFSALDWKALDAVPLKDFLSQLPFLSKQELRDNSDVLRSRKSFYSVTKKTTGGSTGQAVTLLKNSRALACERAAMWRGYEWAGINICDRQARFWGVPFTSSVKMKNRLLDILSNRKRFSAFAFDDGDMMHYCDALADFKPAYLYGYVSMLTCLAHFFKEQKIPLWNELKAVVTTSEVLTLQDRLLLGEVFKCDVFNEYGCGEVGSIAHECEMHSLHVTEENLIVEILDGDRHCADGEVGEIVVTDLNNFALPLFRYRLGDYATYSDNKCTCGRGLSIVKDIVGRAYDILHIRGRMYHGEFFMYVFEDVMKKQLAVKQFQVIQLSEESLLIKIVPDKEYSAAINNFIEQQLRGEIHTDLQIRFEVVDSIPRERSGKMRLIRAVQ